MGLQVAEESRDHANVVYLRSVSLRTLAAAWSFVFVAVRFRVFSCASARDSDISIGISSFALVNSAYHEVIVRSTLYFPTA